jgi:hypothetical protein
MGSRMRMSWTEIRQRYPAEWVALSLGTYDDDNELVSAVVLDHCPVRSGLKCRGPVRTLVRHTGPGGEV